MTSGSTPSPRWAVAAAVGLAPLTLISFGAIHAWLIAPIWPQLWSGMPFVTIASIGWGWMYAELRSALTVREWMAGATIGSLAWCLTLPVTVLTWWLADKEFFQTQETLVALDGVVVGLTGLALGRWIRGRWMTGVAMGLTGLAIRLSQQVPDSFMVNSRSQALWGMLLILYIGAGIVHGLVTGWLDRMFTPKRINRP